MICRLKFPSEMISPPIMTDEDNYVNKNRQRWSTIPPILTKPATTSDLKPVNTKKITAYGFWNSRS